MGGMGGMGAQGGANTNGQAQQAPSAPNPAAPPPPQFEGAPTSAEEEERLLQEAIRLSMQDSGPPNQGQQEGKKDGEDGNHQS